MLHGVQLWVALPDAARHAEPAFEHYAPPAVTGEGWAARVFLGTLLGATSPVPRHTPLLGAELELTPGTPLDLDVDAGVRARRAGRQRLRRGRRAAGQPGRARRTSRPGRSSLDRSRRPTDPAACCSAAPPFGEQIVMWWNFVGRTHDEVVAYREEWQDQLVRDGVVVGDSQDVADGRFGIVVGDHLPPIPAPEMPQGVRLRSRG